MCFSQRLFFIFAGLAILITYSLSEIIRHILILSFLNWVNKRRYNCDNGQYKTKATFMTKFTFRPFIRPEHHATQRKEMRKLTFGEQIYMTDIFYGNDMI